MKWQIAGAEGRLFHLGKVVYRVTVEFHDAHLNQRVVGAVPCPGKVEGVDVITLDIIPGPELKSHTVAEMGTAL